MSLEDDRFDFNDNEEYDELNDSAEEEEIFHEEYYNQLLEDLAINIKLKFDKYLSNQGLNWKILSHKIVDLLQN
jgi:hypothetical protein